MQGDIDDFPQDVLELIAYLGDPQPGQPVRAIPGEGSKVPVWMLGSSLYGAQLAAALGLPYAFASHFAPEQLAQALELYRAQFRPSPFLDKPHVMLGLNVVAAETRCRGATSFHLAAAGLRQSAHRQSRTIAAADRRHDRLFQPIRASKRCWTACCRWRRWDRRKP